MEFQDKMLKCVDCGTDFVFTAGEQLFLLRQAVQKRTQTLQELQGETGRGAGRCARAAVRQDRDSDQLFAMRQGDDGTISSDPGAAGAVPGMFSAETASRKRLIHPEELSESGETGA